MIAEGEMDSTSDQCISAARSTNAGTPADNRTVFRPCGQNQKPVHRNIGRKTRWQEKTRQAEAKMDR